MRARQFGHCRPMVEYSAEYKAWRRLSWWRRWRRSIFAWISFALILGVYAVFHAGGHVEAHQVQPVEHYQLVKMRSAQL
ncbi:MAG TPA: hypothetical protein VHA37_02870 [Candidatus Saccharimonadales bacterium]|nr:hypothetical protein [Candidatus Saccharimonadales bacterium]